MQYRWFFLGLLWLWLAPTVHAFEDPPPRHALVIGNSDYLQFPLPNAGNDAVDIAAALEELGYQVSLHRDLEAAEFSEVAIQFYESIDSARAISVFYYAGHAVQLDNRNYLLPVNGQINDIEALVNTAYPLDELLLAIGQSTSAQNVLVLDACRNNSFEDLVNNALGQLAGGLAQVEAPANTLIAFATEPGGVASDGSGRNGAYTAALLQFIGEALPVEELFKKVRKEVMRTTRELQIPWEHSSLTQEFYFGPPANQDISDIVGF